MMGCAKAEEAFFQRVRIEPRGAADGEGGEVIGHGSSTSNTQHPTSNIQWVLDVRLRHWMSSDPVAFPETFTWDVERWMLDVARPFRPRSFPRRSSGLRRWGW